MVKNVSIKSRGKKILKLKGNSQSEIVGGQVSFLFLFFSCVFFAINCVGYFTVKSLMAATTILIARRQVNH